MSISDVIAAFQKKHDYLEWLESMEGKRAIDLGKKECLRCGYCCARRPCIPTPEELKNIAEYLDMNIKEMIKKYFVCDAFIEGSTKFLFPAKSTQVDITGKYIDWGRTYDKGYCIFYDTDKHICKIWSVRPEHAKYVNCWKKEDIPKDFTNKIVSTWKNINLEEYGIKE